MQYLELKTVENLAKALEIGQVPMDEVRITAQRWLLASEVGEINCEDGAREAAKQLLMQATR